MLAGVGPLVVVAALLVAGCTSGAESTEPSVPTTSPSTSTSEAPTPDRGDEETRGENESGGDGLRGPELRARLAQLEGQLALGNGPALAVARPDGGALQVVGRDGENSAQPTWSRDGRALAWSSTSPQRQDLVVQRFDDGGQPDGDPEVSTATGFPIFYLQWDGGDERLAYLRNGQVPGLIEFGVARPGEPVAAVASETPFFVAWSPAAPQVLAHVAQDRVELHDADAPEADPTVVLDQGSDYSAPAWVDDRRAVVVVDDALVVLNVSDGTIEELAPAEGPIRFVVSPDGRRVAYRLLPDRSQGPLTASVGTDEGQGDGGDDSESEDEGDDDGVVVLDLETGERELVGDDSVAAWEWSPDGSRLAWLSVRSSARPFGRWHFWSADGEEPGTGATPEFSLTRKYAEVYLPFFAQYSHSVTGWAPDSSAFAFAGSVQGDAGIWVQLVDERAVARRISVGDAVTWGPGPTPDEGAGTSAA